METIKFDQARPGMVLAAPLIGAGGIVMLPLGTRLTAMMLQRLARVAVAEFTIVGAAEAAPAPRPVPSTLGVRFRPDDGSGILAEIQRVAIRHEEARRNPPGTAA